MGIIAVSSDKRHILVETEKDRGYIEDKQTGVKTAEKSIVALLSANIDWEDPEEPIIDAYTPEIYDFLDEQISKSGMNISGNLPRGAKTTGIQTEQFLYGSLKQAIDEFLDSLSGTETEVEVIQKLQEFVQNWYTKNEPLIDKAFHELFKAGIAAGIASAGVKTFTPQMGAQDIHAIELLKASKYRIGARIRLFGDDVVKEFAGIITKAYTPEGQFSLDWLTKEMRKAVQAERWKLERVARTETAAISTLGRIFSWEHDPLKHYFRYSWSIVPDNRAKEISKLRATYNPLTFDEAKFLWLHQNQYIPSLKRFQNDTFNQRCTISRYPIDEEFTGNRFLGQETSFEKTLDVDF